jgi:hypothetical protein
VRQVSGSSRRRDGESRLLAIAGAVLAFRAGRWWGAHRSTSTAVTSEPAPPKKRTKRTKPEALAHAITTPVRKKDQEKRREEENPPAKPPPSPGAGQKRIGCLSTGCCGAEKPAEEKPGGDEGRSESGLSGIVVKALGAAAAGIGITGAVVVVGAAIFWARFDAMGVPPVQAVTAIPRTELLVQGGQEMVIFVGVALVATLLIALADPKGVITYGSLGVLGLLLLGATVYALCSSATLGLAWVLFLVALAAIFGLVSICVGFATGQRLVPVLLSVFILTFAFSATCAFLIVQNQKFGQAIAIRFGLNEKGEDKGLTGIYVTATDKTIYFARTDLNGAANAGLYEVPRADATTYAVGPLEPLEAESGGESPLEKRAGELLARLKTDAESFAAPKPAEAETKEAATSK